MEYTTEDMLEARQQIESLLHKLRTTVETLELKHMPLS